MLQWCIEGSNPSGSVCQSGGMVDTPDSKSGASRRESSTLSSGTPGLASRCSSQALWFGLSSPVRHPKHDTKLLTSMVIQVAKGCGL